MPRARSVTEQRRHKMSRLRAKGLTFQEIAEQLGVSHQFVQQDLKRYGINGLVPIRCQKCNLVITQMRTAYDRKITASCLGCLAPRAGFAQRLRAHRLTIGMTRRELAERAGIGHATVVRYELGSQIPTLDVLRKLTRVLGTRLAKSG
jgi:transcriptional regulator with XRE-family HTH domain